MNVQNQLKKRVKRILTRGWILRLAGTLAPPLLAILRYHSVAEEPGLYEDSIGTGIVHSRRLFREQMRMVAQDYHPVTLDDLVQAHLRATSLPRRAVAITFDDGFADNYEVVAPILEETGIRAAFYITVAAVECEHPPWFIRLRHAFRTSQNGTWSGPEEGSVFVLSDAAARRRAFVRACEGTARLTGRAQERKVREIEDALGVSPFAPRPSLMMTWNQIRELHRAGHIVGSHSLTHPNLAYVDLNEARVELSESRDRLARELGASVDHFAYPSPVLQPHCTEQTVALSRASGYKTAVTCHPGPVRLEDDCLLLKRNVVPTDLDEFRWVLEATLVGRVL